MPSSNKAMKKTPNALINEKSPYLLQHAYNPVDWFPWGKEALSCARNEDKPIFLSIGYSTCHWCHVMARESFENMQTADILNANFICIKVDREERPDLDEIYMKSVQMLAGAGGWPLSVFLTPDKTPFYGGTYFPPEPRHGLPAFNDLLLRIIHIWRDNREQILSNSEQIIQLLHNSYLHKPQISTEAISSDLLDNAYEQLILQFDSDYGGFSTDIRPGLMKTPKFPQPGFLSFLLRYYHRTKEKSALTMVEKTLYAMAEGGIFDHLGGGFHRYSTDNQWLIPHFEKMLYDNALLSRVYFEAYQITGNSFFSQTGKRTLDWVIQEMTSPSGGFYTALDADSEGTEGAFYVWSPAEITSVLDKELSEIICQHFGITRQGNFEEGSSVLHIAKSVSDVNYSDATIEAIQQLLNARNQRVRPATDDKIITGLNGLMISALTAGYQILHDKRFLEAATSAARFILDNLLKEGQLYRRYRDHEVAIPANLEDYTFFIAALLDLYEASFDQQWQKKAIRLNESMIEMFWDKVDGGFYFNAHGETELIVSIKEAYDGPTPSGNSIAAQNLLRLASITGNEELTTYAVKNFLAFGKQLEQNPLAYTQMLCGVDFYLSSPLQIVIVSQTRKEAGAFVAEINRHFVPNRILLLVDSDVTVDELTDLIPLIRNKVAIQGNPTVYICENFTCKTPITNLDDLKQALI
ncbi:hypothetical protein C5S42_10230 [Candidatus Methanomarinus sp.]|nr:hypothetical protein C5S42_10230 [ANME-2 cluster archaeon]